MAIFPGSREDFGEGARDDGEEGVEEEARREWRMYFAESLSISCWSSKAEVSVMCCEGRVRGLAVGPLFFERDFLQNMGDFVR